MYCFPPTANDVGDARIHELTRASHRIFPVDASNGGKLIALREPSHVQCEVNVPPPPLAPVRAGGDIPPPTPVRLDLRFAVLTFLLGSVVLLSAKDPKIGAQEVVAGHLLSLGTPEARADVTSRIAEGKVQMRIIVGGVGTVDGRAYLFGEKTKFRAALPFDFNDYWGEHYSTDGDNVDVGFSQLNLRSPLGNFLSRYPALVKEGLVGGVLSTSWALLDAGTRQPKLDYGGVKKVDGKDAHLITYRMKKGQEGVTIQLYFDSATFHHVRTLYSVSLVSRLGPTIESSSSQQERRFSLEETFGDFQAFDGVNLPTRWLIRTTVNGDGASVREWHVMFSKITHNATIDPKNFVIFQAAK